MRVTGHDEHRSTERRLLSPPAPPPVVGPIADLRAELATSHDLRADSLTPRAGQGAIQRDRGIRLVHAMDHPAVEPLEELLGTTDRRVERHLLAGGIAVEGDVEVVNPGAGQGNSSIKRFYGVRTQGPSGMAKLIARAAERHSGRPRPAVTFTRWRHCYAGRSRPLTALVDRRPPP